MVDAACAMDYGDVAGEVAQARELAIADTSVLKRWGLKGWNTAPWLREHGCTIGEPANVATAAAIANAVYNAIGVRIRELPITPRTVLAALRQGGAS